jgi:hypothetical protein
VLEQKVDVLAQDAGHERPKGFDGAFGHLQSGPGLFHGFCTQALVVGPHEQEGCGEGSAASISFSHALTAAGGVRALPYFVKTELSPLLALQP